MKQKLEEKVQIPEGVSCIYENGILKCSKGSETVEKSLKASEIETHISGNEVVFLCKKGNKNHYKKIMTQVAHTKNLFKGLDNKYIYTLEICHVHFPMTIKVEGNKLSISNFFGEKKSRQAKILPNVNVEIKGTKLIVSSANRESAGQTAANFERSTRLTGRDRRIFQDGLYIVSKPGDENA